MSGDCFKNSINRWGFGSLVDSVKDAASSVVDSIKETAGNVVDGVTDVVSDVKDSVCSKPSLEEAPSVCIAEKMEGVSRQLKFFSCRY